jgi:hypothetical protein
VTAGSQYLDILSTNNSAKIRQNSKSLLGMSIETRTSRLVKKTGVEKSRWTVPLKECCRLLHLSGNAARHCNNRMKLMIKYIRNGQGVCSVNCIYSNDKVK